jgi:hypothetical protein
MRAPVSNRFSLEIFFAAAMQYLGGSLRLHDVDSTVNLHLATEFT